MSDSQGHLDRSLDTPNRQYNLLETIICPEYWPIGRYEAETEKVDGVPDDVLGPDGDWMPIEEWIPIVASGWTRTVESNTSSSETGSTANQVQEITFSQVVNYRLSKQEHYADTVRTSLELQHLGLLQDNPVVRRELILISLGIKDHRGTDFHELLDWFESSVVQIPWNDYQGSYLDLDAQTQNPLWPRVQGYLANSNRERGYSNWERLGYGDWLRPIDKSDWTHEDHACRFILYFYDLLTHPELPQEHQIHGRLSLEKCVGQRTTESCDEHDKAWFGYSLLCLLIRSWQYKQHDPLAIWGCNEGLVPAMYPSYSPNRYTSYPPVQVGEPNLSPFTPWVHEDNNEYDMYRSDEDEDEDGEEVQVEYAYAYEEESEDGYMS